MDSADVYSFVRAEVLKRCINDVKGRAQKQRDIRGSPRKYYSGVKSKIAGNMRSQFDAKRRARVQESDKGDNEE